MREGEPNDALTFILEGSVLSPQSHGSGADVAVGTEAGAFWVSFRTTVEEGVFTARDKDRILAFRLRKTEFDSLPAEHPRLFTLLESLIIPRPITPSPNGTSAILTFITKSRTDHGIWNPDRNQLRQALDELKNAGNRLIHQEKMAILGQLVAGIAP